MTSKSAPSHMLARAVLTAAALVLLVLPVAMLAGVFFPSIPRLNELGGRVSDALPWLWPPIVLALLLTSLAIALGGRRGAAALLAVGLVGAIAAGIVTVRYTSFAAEHGATYDLARAYSASARPRTSDETMVFATVGGIQLHLNLWRPTNGAAAAPGLVYVHGGGFVGGSLDTSPQLFATLADGGIAVIDIEYRLAPPPRWLDAPGDVLCALAWLRANAAAQGIDPDRVVVMGQSAGGSLALLASYAAGTDLLAASCAGDPIIPRGVIATVPAADLEGLWSDGTMVAAGLRFPEAYIGGSPAAFPDRYDMASPGRLIRAALPPTMLVAAEMDRWVHPARVASIAEILRAAGIDARYVLMPFVDHGFDAGPNSFGAQLEEGMVASFVREVTR